MSTLQATILGMLLVLTPSALFLTWVLWQDGKLPPHDQLELSRHRFENTASDLIDCADHINDEIITRQQLVARLRLINSCRLVLVMVGFTVIMNRKPRVVEDDQEGLAPRRDKGDSRGEARRQGHV
jgi:hypothetical protein